MLSRGAVGGTDRVGLERRAHACNMTRTRQAPSDYPEFATWLVGEQIDSISLNPDVAIATTIRVAEAEGTMSGVPLEGLSP